MTDAASRRPTWSPSCAGGASPTSTTRRSTRALYSSDASLYRVVPQVVARPRHPDELLAILDASRALGVPVTMRGAGTSIAGNAVGPGIVVDTVRHLNRVLAIDPEARTAVVQPGVVHADAAARGGAARAALRAGPVDPHPLHDRRDDRQQRLRLAGARLRPDRRQRGRAAGGVRDRRGGRAGPARRRRTGSTGLGRRLPRRWSTSTSATCAPSSAGSPGRSAATRSSTCCPRTAAGSTGSWSAPRARSGWSRGDGRAGAGRAASGCWSCSATRRWSRRPTRSRRCLRRAAVGWSPARGWTARIVDLVRARGSAVPELPRGAGWLFVEVAGDDADALVAAAGRRGGRARAPGRHRPAEAAALWRIREDGAGLAARSLPTPGVLRLGGRRRAARAPRRLAARLRRAAARARPRRRALRPLRRRLRARADRLRVRRRRQRRSATS